MSGESRMRDIMILKTMRDMVYTMSSTYKEEELLKIINEWMDFLQYPILKGEKVLNEEEITKEVI